MKKVDKFYNEQGKEITIQEFADFYFEIINPKRKDGEYMVNGSLIGRLRKRINKYSKDEKEFYEYFLDEKGSFNRLRKIVLGNPIDLQKRIIKNVEIKAKNIGFKWTDKRKLNMIKAFNYDLIRKNQGLWLIKSLGVNSCLYCGSQYVLGLDKSKKITCQLDHFFPKSKFPYLSVSLFNLIPSCNNCNKLKTDDPTLLGYYPNPYSDDLNSLFSFKSNPADTILKIIKNKQIKDVELKPNAKIARSEKTKTSNHIQRFQLKSIYKNHTDKIEELYWRKQVYNTTRKKELVKLLKGQLLLTKGEIDRFITGNYVSDEELLKRPLSKLVKDISEEIKLLE